MRTAEATPAINSSQGAQRFLPESMARLPSPATKTAGLSLFEIVPQPDKCKILGTHHARTEPQALVHCARLSFDGSIDQLARQSPAMTLYRQLGMADDNTIPLLFETAGLPPSNCEVVMPCSFAANGIIYFIGRGVNVSLRYLTTVRNFTQCSRESKDTRKHLSIIRLCNHCYRL